MTNFPPQSSLFGCRFDFCLHDRHTDHFVRLNLACLAVGSTAWSIGENFWQFRLNLACLAVGSTSCSSGLWLTAETASI